MIATTPRGKNHGPVKVWRQTHLAYADGTRYFQFGTTCYAWPHQTPEVVNQTLKTLKAAPFNKMRMCVFPKSYSYNKNEPQFYPYVHVGPMPAEPAKSSRKDWNWDTTRFNPKYFQHLEWCVGELLKLGIEADIILFRIANPPALPPLPIRAAKTPSGTDVLLIGRGGGRAAPARVVAILDD